MAGNYADPPGPRLAWDRDGTQWYRLVNGALTQLSVTDMQKANNEDNDYVEDPGYSNPISASYIWLFPEPRDLMGLKLMEPSATYGGVSFSPIEVSSDTTNGIDGTWTSVTGITTVTSGPVAPGYRTVPTMSKQNVKGLRISYSHGYNSHARIAAAHIYGKPSTVTDRLEFWHPTLNQSLFDFPAHLDWGNRPRATTEVRSVRLKNQSATLVASNITVGLETFADASPTFLSQMSLRYDGGAYAPTVLIDSLTPGQISAVIDIRQALATNAALSVWAQRLYASAAAWA